MSRVWLTIPTAARQRLAQGCLDAWRDQGYKTAVIRNLKDGWPLRADYCLTQPAYQGYGLAVNALAKHVLAADRECQVIVAAGDDVYPCQTKRADEIADEFLAHFGGTLGVMQPHGNAGHHRGKDGRYVPDNVCWSVWLGREWCERAYMGAGPIHPRFFHYYSTTNLWDVALDLGLLWYRYDIIQWDDNWEHVDSKRRSFGMPPYIMRAKLKGQMDKELYFRLKAEGHPGCGLLPL
jgi:hypothetical protein